MVEHLPSKQDTWVRFPSPAYSGISRRVKAFKFNCKNARTRLKAAVAQLVERVLGKDEVPGSIPGGSFLGYICQPRHWELGVTVTTRS